MSQLVAVGVVRRGQNFLITRRPAHIELGGLWEFPGGKVEYDEDPRLAVVRELNEECGIDVEVERVADVVYFKYPHKSVILLFYLCRWVRGEVQHIEVADHRWVPAQGLSEFAFPEANKSILALLCDMLPSDESRRHP